MICQIFFGLSGCLAPFDYGSQIFHEHKKTPPGTRPESAFFCVVCFMFFSVARRRSFYAPPRSCCGDQLFFPLLSVEDDMRFAHDREDVPGVSGRHLFLPFQTAGLLLSPVNAENPVYCVRAQKKRYPSRHRFLCSMVCCYDQCAGTSAVCYPGGLFPAVVRWNDVPL